MIPNMKIYKGVDRPMIPDIPTTMARAHLMAPVMVLLVLRLLSKLPKKMVNPVCEND